MKLSDIQSTPPRILLWGLAGSGKTCFSTSEGEATELLNCDQNIRSAALFQDKFTERRKNCEITNCLDSNSALTFTKLKNRVYDIAAAVANKSYIKRVLVLDSLTACGDSAMRMVLSNSGKLVNTTSKTLPQPTQQDWGLAIGEVENLLTILCSIPVAVVVVAHELRDEVNGQLQYVPWALGNKLPTKLPRFFSEVWYSKLVKQAGSQGDKYVIQTNATSTIMARSSVLRGDIPMDDGIGSVLGKIGWEVTSNAKN